MKTWEGHEAANGNGREKPINPMEGWIVTKQERGTLKDAHKHVARLAAAKVAGNGPGSIRKWSNGQTAVTFVPDHAYSSFGLIVVQEHKGV